MPFFTGLLAISVMQRGYVTSRVILRNRERDNAVG
jgi:hypothetical protein